MSEKRISPASINALKEALTHIYWYKNDLRRFLTHSVSDSRILSTINWNDYKRNIASQVVDFLANNQKFYLDDLVNLIRAVSDMDDFRHLEALDDGKEKAKNAREFVFALRKYANSHEEFISEKNKTEERKATSQETIKKITAVTQKLEELKNSYWQLLSSTERQKRGYQLEKILKELFSLFDLDPKASFKIVGEQIDGSFTFENLDYLLEAKWQDELVRASDLYIFAEKLTRKLDNTLGLFISIEGFSEEAVSAYSGGRKLMILMDGSDLMAVLESRIDLIQLLRRKRRHASQTGNIYLKVKDIL